MAKAVERVVLVASSEFILKSAPVRRTLEQRLIDDLRFALKRSGHEYSRVEKEAARLVVFGVRDTEAVAALCGDVFGVAYSAPAELLTNASLAEVTGSLTALARHRLGPGKSFAIRCRRSTPSSISRREVELQGGSSVLTAMKDRGVRVDLGNPDVTFYVDLVGQDAYVYSQKLKGPGGLPLSAEWKMLAVLDRGLLSVLAAEAMMRRGCVVHLFIPVSKHLPALSSERQMALAEKVSRLVTRPNYVAFVMEVDGVLGAEEEEESDWRSLVREAAARFAWENRFRGVVFGDVSGELAALSGVSMSTQPPTFYPLLGLQPEDFTELLRLAGSEEIDVTLDDSKSGFHSVNAGSLTIDLQTLPVKEVRL